MRNPFGIGRGFLKAAEYADLARLARWMKIRGWDLMLKRELVDAILRRTRGRA